MAEDDSRCMTHEKEWRETMVILTDSKMNQFDYKDWSRYFTANHRRRLKIDFSEEQGLTEEERRLIFPSIRAFQKGEGSDGRHLLDAAKAFAKETGNPEYEEAMSWFVKEENWHSAYLRRYMNFYQVKPAEKSFLDHMFRRLRQVGGLKCEVTILVTAEMIALTYYDALGKCTDSPALKSICGQMLHDELPHISFQSYTLSHFKNSLVDRWMRIGLMEVTLLLVWGAFHRVYEAGGYSFRRYLKENLGYLRQSLYLSEDR